MNHPFDDNNLMFSDLKNIVINGLAGKLNREDKVSEKLDGQNLMVSWVDGKLKAARNKGHLKNGGKTAPTTAGIANMFSGRGNIKKAFVGAMRDLEKSIGGLSNAQKKKVFGNGTKWMNLEVIYPQTSNIIDYDVAEIVFHGTTEYDRTGRAKGYSKDKEGIILGGNFTSWYSGLDSYLISHAVNEPITNVSMGRKQPEEDMIPDIKYLPYMSWREWIQECGKYKVGIHMMRTHAAGTFGMNLAYHSTPCLGYSGLDTQDLLHPQTTVKLGNIAKAQSILKKLYDDEGFYRECSLQTKELFDKYYSEEAWSKDFKKVNKEFKNG